MVTSQIKEITQGIFFSKFNLNESLAFYATNKRLRQLQLSIDWLNKYRAFYATKQRLKERQS